MLQYDVVARGFTGYNTRWTLFLLGKIFPIVILRPKLHLLFEFFNRLLQHHLLIYQRDAFSFVDPSPSGLGCWSVKTRTTDSVLDKLVAVILEMLTSREI